MTLHVIIIAGYFLFVLLLSASTRKASSRSSSDFLVAGRSMGVWVCASVIAGEWLGGMSTIGVSESAYLKGSLQPVLYNLSIALGMVVIGFTVAAKYRERRVHTVSEMLVHLFGPGARTATAIPFLLAYVILGFVQLQTCAGVMSGVLHLPWNLSVLLSSLVTTLYTYLGGMHAIALVNIVHLVVRTLGIGLACVLGMIKVGGFGGLQRSLLLSGAPAHPFNPFSGGLDYALSLFLGGFLGGLAAQASIQPIFSAKDPATAKRASLLSSLLIAPFGLLTALLGLIARTGNFVDPASLSNTKSVLPALLASPSFVSPWVGGIAIAGILAAILSTVAPVNFAVVTIAAKDLYQAKNPERVDDHRLVVISRRLVILVNLLILPLALFVKGSVLDTAYLSYSIRSIGGVIIVLALYRRGWINLIGVKMAFWGGIAAMAALLFLDACGILHIPQLYGALGAAFFFLVLGKLVEEVSKRRRRGG